MISDDQNMAKAWPGTALALALDSLQPEVGPCSKNEQQSVYPFALFHDGGDQDRFQRRVPRVVCVRRDDPAGAVPQASSQGLAKRPAGFLGLDPALSVPG